jgi:hypothetical protein
VVSVFDFRTHRENSMKRTFVRIIVALSLVAVPAVGSAHNLGHFTLPDGSCQQIGSGKEAPLVGKDRTQLDLVPQTANPPRDEYGASFVGFSGNTPILPGPCPAQSVVTSEVDTGAAPTSGMDFSIPTR